MGGFYRSEHRRRVGGQLLQVAACAQQEHTAVPQVVARGHVFRGALGIRLFNEGIHGVHRACSAGMPDIAVARLGARRHYAEGDELASSRRLQASLHGIFKRRDILQHMVRRHDEQQGALAGQLQGRQRSRSHGRGRVAPHRFEDERCGRQPHLTQLFRDDEAVVFVADHHGRVHARPLGHAQRRVLQHGVLARQRQQLLRELFARKRPQARACTTGKDDGDECHSVKLR